MASGYPFEDDAPLAQKIKSLGDEELLEFWDESQHIEQFVLPRLPRGMVLVPDYEQVIVNELFLRESRRRFCGQDAGAQNI